MTSSERPSRCWRGRSTAGSTPLAPAVGAATMRRIQALHSPVFRAVAMTAEKKGPHSPPPCSATRLPSPPTRSLDERSRGVYWATLSVMAAQR